MESNSKITQIELSDLLTNTMQMKENGYRLAQICSAYVDGKYELSYSFAKDYDLENYRIIVEKEEPVPSITDIYECAFLYENEIKELFGVNMEYIHQDYMNKLYRINETAPFIKEEEK